MAPSEVFHSLLYNDFWGGPLSHPGSHKSWRPLTTLSFRWNVAAHGLTTMGFHVVNVLLHGVCSCLVFLIASRYLHTTKCVVLCSVLFSVHSIHCDAVCSLVGRADVLCSLFVLLALFFDPLGKNLLVTSLLSLLALLSKETGIALIPLLIINRVIERKKASSCVPLLLLLSLLVTARLWINSFAYPSFGLSNNPVSHSSSLLTRSLTLFVLPLLHLWMLFYPKTLCFDWSMDSVPLVSSPLDPRFLLAISVYTFLVLIIIYSIRHISHKDRKAKNDPQHRKCAWRVLLCSLSILIVPHLLTSSNLLVSVGFVVAERILYLPSAGFCILIGFAFEQSLTRLRKECLPSLIALSLLIAMASRTIERNVDWRDDESLYRSAIHVNPAKAYANLGQSLAARGRGDEAQHAYLTALLHRNNMADTHYNLGVLYGERGNHSLAVHSYTQAIRIRHAFASAYLNMGYSLRRMGKRRQAMQYYETCSLLEDNNTHNPVQQWNAQTSCAFNLGLLHMEDNNYNHAIPVLHRALSLCPSVCPSKASIYTQLGEAYSAIGMDEMAEETLTRAMREDQSHAPALIATALLNIRRNRSSDGWNLLHEAARLSPNSSIVHLHIGIAHLRRGETERARKELELSLSIQSDQTEALRALATIERNLLNHDRAEQLLRRLVDIEPSPSNLATLGAQLHLNEKYLEAERIYIQSLTLKPTDNVTRENLQKLRRIISH